MQEHSLGRVDSLQGLMRYHYCELQDRHDWQPASAEIQFGWMRCQRCGERALPPPIHINCRCIMIDTEVPLVEETNK